MNPRDTFLDLKEQLSHFLRPAKEEENQKPTGRPSDLYIERTLDDSRKLIRTLSEVEENLDFFDYSFVVLPAAKAFEGALKKLATSLDLVKRDRLKSNPEIPVGKYFNPSAYPLIFDYLKDRVRDRTLPDEIYITYQLCRNRLLHYDLYNPTPISFEEAITLGNQIVRTMNKLDRFRRKSYVQKID